MSSQLTTTGALLFTRLSRTGYVLTREFNNNKRCLLVRIVVRAMCAHVRDVVEDGGVDDVLHGGDDAVRLGSVLHH